MPTALIADDESYLIDYLQAQLRHLWPELQIVATAMNGLDALRLSDELNPDIAFLDIRMPGLTGLDVAQRFADSKKNVPHVVFITAYEQHAVAAFEHSAIDYLLKPPTAERLQKTVEKLKVALQATRSPEIYSLLGQLSARLQASASNASNSTNAKPHMPANTVLQWIRAAHGEETRLISIDDVIYFQSNDKYTCVFTAEGESLIRTPMRELQTQLDTTQFWQIHRSTIVAVKHISATKRDFRGRLLVKLKERSEELVVSRNFADLFKQM